VEVAPEADVQNDIDDIDVQGTLAVHVDSTVGNMLCCAATCQGTCACMLALRLHS
jgi:hypothetical protein